MMTSTRRIAPCGGCGRLVTSILSLATIYNTLHQFVGAHLLREVVVNPGRSYFDTNVADHHHFFFEDEGELMDIPGEHIEVARLPAPPQGSRLRRVDVILRVAGRSK